MKRTFDDVQVNFWHGVMAMIVLSLPAWLMAQTTVPAFPGAEGFGASAVGGRGGDVYIVTSLDDTWGGSLRYGIETANGPRTIVFEVSGTIELQSPLEVDKSNITIAGQTAPGDGITLSGYNLKLKEDHLIVRHLRSRLGDQHQNAVDAVHVSEGSHIMLDHLTASWSIDETFSFQSENIDSITVQWCMITESLNDSYHPKGDHGYGQIIGALHQSVHHNLYAHHNSRSPKVSGRRHCEVDFRNNVIYNWGKNNCYDGASSYMNWTKNYYKAGPGTEGSKRHRIFQLHDEGPDTENYETSLYAEENFVHGYPSVTEDNWAGGIDFKNGGNEADHRAYTPFDFPGITEQSAVDAYPIVLENAGASMARDPLDQRIVDEVETGQATYSGSKTGKPGIIDCQEDVGGLPVLYSLPAPEDTDRDGMPDFWEEQFGLDKNNSADNAEDPDGDVYTNIEEYINNTSPQGGEQQIVYITAADSRAIEDSGNPGEFIVRRSGNLDQPLTVLYNVSGTAQNGTDYASLGGTVEFQAGQSAISIAVEPVVDSQDEGIEKVIATVDTNSADYKSGCPVASLVIIKDDASTDIEPSASPEGYTLLQIYPNPFNPETQIMFHLDKTQDATLKIFDLTGKEVKTLMVGRLEAGEYRFTWDGRDHHGAQVATGVYICRLRTAEGVSSERMVLLK